VKNALAVALALAAPLLAEGQAAAPPPGAVPLGVVVQAGLGAGGMLGGGSDYTRKSLFEGEVAVGWEAGLGIRPELAVAIGVAPRGHLALRPGLHYSPPELPFYLRAALDWSTLRGSGGFRWLLAGAGAEVRLTDVLGAFGEADLGLPFARNVGIGLLVRAGVSFRF
jgi:hypothetical protein